MIEYQCPNLSGIGLPNLLFRRLPSRLGSRTPDKPPENDKILRPQILPSPNLRTSVKFVVNKHAPTDPAANAGAR